MFAMAPSTDQILKNGSNALIKKVKNVLQIGGLNHEFRFGHFLVIAFQIRSYTFLKGESEDKGLNGYSK